MNSLLVKAGVPQIRCRAVTGGDTPALFPYEVNVQGRWIASNYQFAAWVVGSGRWMVRDAEPMRVDA